MSDELVTKHLLDFCRPTVDFTHGDGRASIITRDVHEWAGRQHAVRVHRVSRLVHAPGPMLRQGAPARRHRDEPDLGQWLPALRAEGDARIDRPPAFACGLELGVMLRVD